MSMHLYIHTIYTYICVYIYILIYIDTIRYDTIYYSPTANRLIDIFVGTHISREREEAVLGSNVCSKRTISVYNGYVYMYIYMCVYIYIYTHTHKHTQLRTHIYI